MPMQAVSQRRVVRGTAAFLLTSAAQRGVSFILLPVFATVLSPAEFGQIGIIGTIAGAVAATLGLGLETSIFRTLIQLRARPNERRRYLNSVGLFAMLVPAVAAAVLAAPIGIWVERAYGIPIAWVSLGVIGAGLSVGATAVCFASLRAEERLRSYMTLGAAQVALHVGLPLWLVVVEGAGVAGWFGGTALGSALLLVVGLRLIRHRFTFDLDRRYIAGALAFGVPMVPHALAHWGLALSDRIVLGALVTNSDVGVYHLAYQFGLPITMLGAALAQSTQPLFAEASLHGSASTSDIRRATTYQALLVIALGATIALLGGPVVRLLLPETFAAAAALIPWIALGSTLFGLYFIPMNVIVLLAGRNQWVWVITVCAAATNVVLNVVLVPGLGILGAAINTAIGYGVLLVGVAWYAGRTADLLPGYEWRRMLLGVSLVAATLLALAFETSMPVLDIGVRLVALGILATVLFGLRLFPAGIFRLAWSSVPSLWPTGRKP